MNLYIPKGKQWARPWSARARYAWLPPVTRATEIEWRCQVDFGACPTGTQIKLVGTAEFRPFGCLPAYPLHLTHDDSDRFVCMKHENGVAVYLYGYRECRGGVTGGVDEYHKGLGVVPEGAPFTVALSIGKHETTYRLGGERAKYNYVEYSGKHGGETSIHRDGRGRVRFWAWPHADGYDHDTAPKRIELAVDRRVAP